MRRRYGELSDRSLVPMLGRALRLRCPHCGARGLLAGWFRLAAHCPGCGYRPERADGFGLGSTTVSMAVTFAAVGITGAVAMVVTWPDVPILGVTLAVVAVAVVVPIAVWPLAQLAWAAADLAMRPLEPAELAAAQHRLGSDNGPDTGPGAGAGSASAPSSP